MIERILIIIVVAMYCVGCSIMNSTSNTKILSKNQISSLAIDGSIHPILEYLAPFKENLQSEEGKLYNKYQLRFILREEGKAAKTGSILLDSVLIAYQEYWQNVLLKEMSKYQGFNFLYDKLNKIAMKSGKDFGNMNRDSATKLSIYLKDKLKAEGHYSLWGITEPHAEFMVWKNQTNKTYSVKLTDEIVNVKVVMLDKFLSYGWLGYATFDHKHTGGWAKINELVCVASSYDLNSEVFKISYLKHEGRHFADYRKFPKIKGEELEYRAKLTELAFANSTLESTLDQFYDEANNQKNTSHTLASYKVIKDLKSYLNTDNLLAVSKEKLNEAAKHLLEINTNILAKK